MYQFTTTTIINNNVDLSTGLTKISATSDKFQVLRTGTFKTINIESLYKNSYKAGTLEIATITVPTVVTGDAYRLELNIKLTGRSHDAEYANFALAFQKPFTYEIIASAVTASVAATDFAAAITAEQTRYGKKYFTVVANGADLVFTAVDKYQRFDFAKISHEYASTNTMVAPAYALVATGSVTTAGVEPFGDYVWMVSNISIPTLDKTRFFATLQDERPTIDGHYNQYTLKYKVEKDGGDGIVASGYSITNHVFYVESAVVSAFETAIVGASIPMDTVGTAVTAITIADNTFDLSANTAAGLQLSYTSTPASVTGGVWSLTGVNTVAGTLDATKISITPGGLFTVATGHGVAAADTIGVKVVVDGYTKTGDITFQA